MISFPTVRALALVAFVGHALGHTWIEQMSVIKDGVYTGDFGYPRGYVARTDSGFTGDSNNYLLPPLSSGRTRLSDSDLLCHTAQRSPEQTDNYPRLKATPGSFMAMRYTENGHVTLPETQAGKPENGGTVFVFGTNEPKSDEKITEVLKWTADGTGGDKRGRLLTAQDYDDGRCYQINTSENSKSRQNAFAQAYPDQTSAAATEQWCETDVKLPDDLEAGKTFTVYWVWSWPTMPGVDPAIADGKDEYYTTCSDIDISASLPEVQAKNAHSLVQQNVQTAAVSDYQSRTAANPNLIGTEVSAPGSSATANVTSATTPATTTAVATTGLATTSVPEASPSMTTIVVTHVQTFTIPIPQFTPGPTESAAQGDAEKTTEKTAEITEYSGKRNGSAKFRFHR